MMPTVLLDELEERQRAQRLRFSDCNKDDIGFEMLYTFRA